MMQASHKVSNFTLFVLAVISLLIVNFSSKATRLNKWHQYKIKSAKIMQEAMSALKDERIARGIPLNTADDPAATGLIGDKNSPITTDKGFLDMKIMTANPNLAAVVVDMFKEAGLRPDDLVAVGYSGSFPAANIAVLSAIESFGLDAVIISSSGASSWGANNPDFTWLDMENFLFKKGIFSHRSIAASLGGNRDLGGGLSSEAKELLERAIKRGNVIYISEGSLEANIYKRLQLYKEFSQKKAKKIKCYINVGGGLASTGSQEYAQLIPNGLSNKLPARILNKTAVIANMSRQNIPVIHLLKMREIIYKYGLAPIPAPKPVIGEGRVFSEEIYNGSVAALAFAALSIIILLGLVIDSAVAPKLRRRADA